MERGERFHQIHRLLKSGGCVPTQRFLDQLEVSRATFMRDIEYLRDRHRAPIEYDKAENGYRYTADGAGFELPGLWFSAEELHALLTMHSLLEQMGSGLLAESVAALRGKLEQLLGDSSTAFAELRKRVRILTPGQRIAANEAFAPIARALVERRQAQVRYWARSTDETTERAISPQRLIHYRGNWYVDAWCHLRGGPRSFAVDGLREVRLLDSPCHEVGEKALNAALGSSYGIFGAKERRWAELRFSVERSRWVRDEIWHPEQSLKLGKDGRLTLRVPYSSAVELQMEILKLGADVEVLDPPELRQAVIAAAQALLRQYGPAAG